MAKLETDFILIDESVVMNGFRALMSGAKLQGFLKNPVMLLQHNRASAGYNPATNDTMLPIGKWYDIRVMDGKLMAKPDFDDNDDFAKKIESKVKGGYLNGASIWIDPVTCSDDDSLALAGQRGPTITEWGILEASIVDIPNCRNALAIRNSAGNKIALSGNSGEDAGVLDYLRTLTTPKTQTLNMDLKKIICTKLGIDENSNETVISEKLSAAITAMTAHTQLAAENIQLKDQVVLLKQAATEKLHADLVDGAVAEGKLAAGDKDKFMKLAAADFETTKSLIDGMKPYESIESRLSVASKDNKIEIEELVKLSGNQLYMDGKLDRLKAVSPEHFKLKYKEAFGFEYTGK